MSVCDTLVLRFIDQLVLGDPWHHGAEFFANFFDLVRGVIAAGGLEAGLADAVFQHPIPGEFTRLNVIENALHLRLGFSGHDPWTGYVIAVFGGV